MRLSTERVFAIVVKVLASVRFEVPQVSIGGAHAYCSPFWVNVTGLCTLNKKRGCHTQN